MKIEKSLSLLASSVILHGALCVCVSWVPEEANSYNFVRNVAQCFSLGTIQHSSETPPVSRNLGHTHKPPSLNHSLVDHRHTKAPARDFSQEVHGGLCENSEKPAAPGVGDATTDFPLKGMMPPTHLQVFL